MRERDRPNPKQYVPLPPIEDVFVNTIALAGPELALAPLEAFAGIMEMSSIDGEKIAKPMRETIGRLRDRIRPLPYAPEHKELGEAMEMAINTLATMGISLASSTARVGTRTAQTLAKRGTTAVSAVSELDASVSEVAGLLTRELESKPIPRIRIRYSEAMARAPSDAQFLRFNAEWAQSQVGSLTRNVRVPEDAALRKASRRLLKKEGSNLKGRAAMHPLDSAANPFAKPGQMGHTFYFGDESVNKAFGGALGRGLEKAGVKEGEQFILEFLDDWPSLQDVPPIAPVSSPPNIPRRVRR